MLSSNLSDESKVNSCSKLWVIKEKIKRFVLLSILLSNFGWIERSTVNLLLTDDGENPKTTYLVPTYLLFVT